MRQRQKHPAGCLVATVVILAGGLVAGPVPPVRAAADNPVVRVVPLRSPFQIVVARRAGRVFVTDVGPLDGRGQVLGTGSVAMLDARTGALLRTIPITAPSGQMVVDETTGRVFVGSQGLSGSGGQRRGQATVLTLDARTGAVAHTTPVGWWVQAMVVDARTHRVFVADGGDFTTRTPGALSVLDARSGAVMRRLPLGHDPSALTLDPRTGHVFLAYQAIAETYYWTSRLTLFMLDGHGALLRMTPLAGDRYLATAALAHRAGRLFLVLQARLDTVVAMLDTQTGTLLRTLHAGASVTTLAVDEERGRVVIATKRQDAHDYPSESALILLDAQTGAVLRTINLRRAQPNRLLINPRTGIVFVSSSGIINRYEHLDRRHASLLLLDARRGAVVRTLPWPWDLASGSFVEPRRGHLVTARPPALDGTIGGAAPGTVAVLDGRTGRVLTTFRAGYYPSALAMDAATNRLFVLDAGPPDTKWRPAGKGNVIVLDAALAMGA